MGKKVSVFSYCVKLQFFGKSIVLFSIRKYVFEKERGKEGKRGRGCCLGSASGFDVSESKSSNMRGKGKNC